MDDATVKTKTQKAGLGDKVAAIFDRILNIFIYISCGLLSVAILLVCIDVVLRYFFRKPTLWVPDVSNYILLYITFLTTAYILRKEKHVIVEVIIGRFNKRWQAILNVFNSIICAALCGTLTWYAGMTALNAIQTGIKSNDVIGTPMSVILGIMPIGLVLLFIQFIRRAYGYYREARNLKPI